MNTKQIVTTSAEFREAALKLAVAFIVDSSSDEHAPSLVPTAKYSREDKIAMASTAQVIAIQKEMDRLEKDGVVKFDDLRVAGSAASVYLGEPIGDLESQKSAQQCGQEFRVSLDGKYAGIGTRRFSGKETNESNAPKNTADTPTLKMPYFLDPVCLDRYAEADRQRLLDMGRDPDSLTTGYGMSTADHEALSVTYRGMTVAVIICTFVKLAHELNTAVSSDKIDHGRDVYKIISELLAIAKRLE